MDSMTYADSIKDTDRIEIFIACRKLKNLEGMFKCDPIVKCYAEQDGKYVFFSETEMIKNSLNPNFSKSIVMDYHFEMKQRIKFEVLEHGSSGKYDFVGEVYTSLNELVGAKNQTSIFDIKNAKQERTGKLILRCEQVRECNETITLDIAAEGLPKCGGLFGSTNPFLKFFRSREDGAWVLVYQTEVVKKKRSPVWQAFTTTVQKLANGDHYRPIKIECLSGKGKSEVIIGEATFNVEEIVKEGKRRFPLKSLKYKSAGELVFRNVNFVSKATFLDYIRGGVQLAAICAIDFTGSNGIPTSPDSLHAIKYDGSLNEYQKAISGVCDILLAYDYDKMIPVYGFGGKPNFPKMKSTQTSHCFPCTGIPENPVVSGLQGIMSSYLHALKNVELSGPTLFAPLISQIMKVAQENKERGSNEYIILLILTDGEIHDMENTINCLIQSARLPLSIIIVGIGSEDFTKMEILDGDDGLFNSNGIKAPRDLVQFVPFRKFAGNHEALAREVLEEVPRQLVEYMESVGRKPDPPKKVDVNALYQRMGTIPEGPLELMGEPILVSDSVAQQFVGQHSQMGIGQNMGGGPFNSYGMNYNNQPEMMIQSQKDRWSISQEDSGSRKVINSTQPSLNSFTSLTNLPK